MNDSNPMGNRRGHPDSTSMNPIFGIGFEASLGMLALLLGVLLGPDPRATIPRIHEWQHVVWSSAWGFGLSLALFILVTLLDYVPLKALQEFHADTNPMLKRLVSGLTWPEAFLVCLSAGIGEELLFRGWLQQGLMEWDVVSWSSGFQPWMGIGIASLFFGAVHFLNLTYFVLATFFGVVFGVVYFYTEDILIVIVGHALYDFLIMWKLRRE